jgi:hypothetical protein
MATATATTITRVTHIKLELSYEEAQTLLYVCNNIFGHPGTTSRKHTDAIGSALQSAGVDTISAAIHPAHIGDFEFKRVI